MRKRPLLEAAFRWRRRLYGGPLPHLVPSLTSPYPLRTTAEIASGGGKVAEALLSSLYPLPFLFTQNQFLASAFHDPGGRGYEVEEEDWGVEWEEEENREPAIGDGGDGGGIVLGNVEWGEHALSLTREVLHRFGDDLALFAFKVSPKGYIYVRLEKLSNRYGCPDIEEIEKFNHLLKKSLDEAGEAGTIPADMALEVSSPGAERLLKIPHDLYRFPEMVMWVCYMKENEDTNLPNQPSEKALIVESIDADAELCIFKLADVQENRAELGKGRPLSRKMKDWRLRLHFKSIHRIKLYLDPTT